MYLGILQLKCRKVNNVEHNVDTYDYWKTTSIIKILHSTFLIYSIRELIKFYIVVVIYNGVVIKCRM